MKFDKAENEQVHVTLNVEEDDMNLIINDKIELHIKFNEGNLSVDAYKINPNASEDEDYDYDEDYISGLGWLSADDLGIYDEDEED